MNGGAWEYVAAYSSNKNGNLQNYGSSEIFPSNELNSIYADYFDEYNVSQDEITNGSISWNAKTTEANKELAKYSYDRVQLMKNKKGDAMYEVIKDFSYYGRISQAHTNDGTQYSAFERFDWLKATYDANGNVTSANDTGVSYGRSYYGSDYALVGEVFQPFLLRGGYWSGGSSAGVFASGVFNGGAYYYHVRFSSCGCAVAL